jgi:hypothetical protein
MRYLPAVVSISLFVVASAFAQSPQTQSQARSDERATAQPASQPAQDQLLIDAANRKAQRMLADLRRDSSAVNLRLMAEVEKAQRHAEVQQEQARLDLAARTALSSLRLGKGSQDKGPQLRQAFTTELAQAYQAFNQRMAEIDAEQNQSVAQALQRFNQQKAEARESYNRELTANVARLTQEMQAADMGKAVAEFKVALPSFAQPAAGEAENEAALESAYRLEADAARKSYDQSVNEARNKVIGNIQRSLEANPEAGDEEQTTAITNAVRRLGLWAADSMDSYQISLKSALRKYQLGESTDAGRAAPAGSKLSPATRE